MNAHNVVRLGYRALASERRETRGKSKKRRMWSFLQQSRKKKTCGVFLAIALLWVVLVAPAQAVTFTVNSPLDVAGAAPFNDGICATAYNNGVPNGVCTLRAAIEEASALAGADQIVLPPDTYILTIVSELIITGDLTIMGAGASTTIIDGNKNVRSDSGVLNIIGVTVNISGLTVQGGGKITSNTGGGVFNSGTLTITNSTVSGNSAVHDGGGIYNAGSLTLINTTVNGNSANFNGGGVYNLGILTLTNSSTVSGNSANASGGGIANTGSVTLINSTVSGNSTKVGGGGILNFSGGTLTITNSTVSGNNADLDGGGIDSLGTMTITNSTVSGNNAKRNGGGVYNSFAGIFGIANLFNVTITNNIADADLNGTGAGGGVFNGSGGTFNFENTILAGNLESEAGILTFRDCSGTLTSHGNNLMRVVNCTVNGIAPTVADPLLGPLQNNGGFSGTHQLLAGSPAIDAGNPSGCRRQFDVLITTDQRGFPRPGDGNNDSVAGCDIGSYELLTSSTSVVAALLPSSRSVQVGAFATAFATIVNAGQVIAAACSIAPLSNVPASFHYQTTHPSNNLVTGSPDTPVNIEAGAAQSFVFALIPIAPIASTDVQFSFDCANTEPAPINSGLNTLLFSASATPIPDIVAVAATLNSDGIVKLAGATGSGAFAVSTVNVGATESITAIADTGSATLPINISLCETNPSTGACISTIGSSVTTTINANATPTFGIFVHGNGTVPFDPAANRIFVRFKDSSNLTRGSTSVAVRTQ
jgi:predicted outer membrane repeat protein